jgi:hypothetical protein
VSETPKDAERSDAVLTPQDHENVRVRREIAARQQAEYDACLAWATAAFGPNWLPSHRHYLVEKNEEKHARKTGQRPQAAATVFTVKNAAGQARHFTLGDGGMVEHASYEAGFGPMLLEPHPARGFEHRGQFCPTHRYSLCFAPYAVYAPMTAAQLAALRATRERKRSEREDERWAEQYPLFAIAGVRRRDG